MIGKKWWNRAFDKGRLEEKWTHIFYWVLPPNWRLNTNHINYRDITGIYICKPPIWFLGVSENGVYPGGTTMSDEKHDEKPMGFWRYPILVNPKDSSNTSGFSARIWSWLAFNHSCPGTFLYVSVLGAHYILDTATLYLGILPVASCWMSPVQQQNSMYWYTVDGSIIISGHSLVVKSATDLW